MDNDRVVINYEHSSTGRRIKKKVKSDNRNRPSNGLSGPSTSHLQFPHRPVPPPPPQLSGGSRISPSSSFSPGSDNRYHDPRLGSHDKSRHDRYREDSPNSQRSSMNTLSSNIRLPRCPPPPPRLSQGYSRSPSLSPGSPPNDMIHRDPRLARQFRRQDSTESTRKPDINLYHIADPPINKNKPTDNNKFCVPLPARPLSPSLLNTDSPGSPYNDEDDDDAKSTATVDLRRNHVSTKTPTDPRSKEKVNIQDKNNFRVPLPSKPLLGTDLMDSITSPASPTEEDDAMSNVTLGTIYRPVPNQSNASTPSHLAPAGLISKSPVKESTNESKRQRRSSGDSTISTTSTVMIQRKPKVNIDVKNKIANALLEFQKSKSKTPVTKTSTISSATSPSSNSSGSTITSSKNDPERKKEPILKKTNSTDNLDSISMNSTENQPIPIKTSNTVKIIEPTLKSRTSIPSLSSCETTLESKMILKENEKPVTTKTTTTTTTTDDESKSKSKNSNESDLEILSSEEMDWDSDNVNEPLSKKRKIGSNINNIDVNSSSTASSCVELTDEGKRFVKISALSKPQRLKINLHPSCQMRPPPVEVNTVSTKTQKSVPPSEEILIDLTDDDDLSASKTTTTTTTSKPQEKEKEPRNQQDGPIKHETYDSHLSQKSSIITTTTTNSILENKKDSSTPILIKDSSKITSVTSSSSLSSNNNSNSNKECTDKNDIRSSNSQSGLDKNDKNLIITKDSGTKSDKNANKLTNEKNIEFQSESSKVPASLDISKSSSLISQNRDESKKITILSRRTSSSSTESTDKNSSVKAKQSNEKDENKDKEVSKNTNSTVLQLSSSSNKLIASMDKAQELNKNDNLSNKNSSSSSTTTTSVSKNIEKETNLAKTVDSTNKNKNVSDKIDNNNCKSLEKESSLSSLSTSLSTKVVPSVQENTTTKQKFPSMESSSSSKQSESQKVLLSSKTMSSVTLTTTTPTTTTTKDSNAQKVLNLDPKITASTSLKTNKNQDSCSKEPETSKADKATKLSSKDVSMSQSINKSVVTATDIPLSNPSNMSTVPKNKLQQSILSTTGKDSQLNTNNNNNNDSLSKSSTIETFSKAVGFEKLTRRRHSSKEISESSSPTSPPPSSSQNIPVNNNTSNILSVSDKNSVPSSINVEKDKAAACEKSKNSEKTATISSVVVTTETPTISTISLTNKDSSTTTITTNVAPISTGGGNKEIIITTTTPTTSKNKTQDIEKVITTPIQEHQILSETLKIMNKVIETQKTNVDISKDSETCQKQVIDTNTEKSASKETINSQNLPSIVIDQGEPMEISASTSIVPTTTATTTVSEPQNYPVLQIPEKDSESSVQFQVTSPNSESTNTIQSTSNEKNNTSSSSFSLQVEIPNDNDEAMDNEDNEECTLRIRKDLFSPTSSIGEENSPREQTREELDRAKLEAEIKTLTSTLKENSLKTLNDIQQILEQDLEVNNLANLEEKLDKLKSLNTEQYNILDQAAVKIGVLKQEQEESTKTEEPKKDLTIDQMASYFVALVIAETVENNEHLIRPVSQLETLKFMQYRVCRILNHHMKARNKKAENTLILTVDQMNKEFFKAYPNRTTTPWSAEHVTKASDKCRLFKGDSNARAVELDHEQVGGKGFLQKITTIVGMANKEIANLKNEAAAQRDAGATTSPNTSILMGTFGRHSPITPPTPNTPVTSPGVSRMPIGHPQNVYQSSTVNMSNASTPARQNNRPPPQQLQQTQNTNVVWAQIDSAQPQPHSTIHHQPGQRTNLSAIQIQPQQLQQVQNQYSQQQQAQNQYSQQQQLQQQQQQSQTQQHHGNVIHQARQSSTVVHGTHHPVGHGTQANFVQSTVQQQHQFVQSSQTQLTMIQQQQQRARLQQQMQAKLQLQQQQQLQQQALVQRTTSQQIRTLPAGIHVVRAGQYQYTQQPTATRQRTVGTIQQSEINDYGSMGIHPQVNQQPVARPNNVTRRSSGSSS